MMSIIMLITQVKTVTMTKEMLAEDEVLAAGPWSKGDEEEHSFIIIPESVTTRSGRVASRVSTVILH